MHLVGGRPGGGTEGIVVIEFRLRQMSIPPILVFLDYHSERLSHYVVHALDAGVVVGMIGACSVFRMPCSLQKV